MISLIFGTWNERASREIRRCPSYYAADWEVLKTVPGRYPLTVSFKGGYTIPMPDTVTCGIPAIRLEGRIYSGFGGVNFAHTELPRGEEVVYHNHLYLFSLRELVEAGTITVNEGFEWTLAEIPWEAPGAPITWEAVRAARDAQQMTVQ